jgi:hypothetical protein
MLQMVAMPVQDRLSVPGPWYSTMAPVPPLTVRIPATLRMMSVVAVSFCASSRVSPVEDGKPRLSRNDLKIKHTLRRSPAGELASKLDTDDLGGLQLPGETSHDIDGIGTTDTDSSHTETTSVGSVRVGTDEESTRESVVLKHDLVDDTRAGLPETNVVLCARCRQEVVNFLVDVLGAGQILLAANLGLDKMVTVDGGGSRNRGHASRHELKNGHLGGGILASYTVGAELEVALATNNLLVVGIVQMGVENLLGEGERAVQPAANNLEVLAHLLVVDVVALLPVGHFDLAGQRGIADGSQLPARSKALADATKPRELLHGVGWGRMEW